MFPYDFGHDRLGHSISNALNRAERFRGYYDLRRATDYDLLSVPKIGDKAVQRIREVLAANPVN